MGNKLKRLFILSTFFVFLSSAQIAHLNFDSYSEAFAASPIPQAGFWRASLNSEARSNSFLPNNSSERSPSDKPQPETESAFGGLDTRTRYALPKYAVTIRKNATVYGMDWRLVLAVMKQESNFNTEAVSERGAYGLMQVMPATGMEVANKLGFDNLFHPHKNIKGGVFYLAKLYDLFEGAPEADQLKLALAAYNAGPVRIYDAQELAAYLGDNPYSWQSIEKALPLLSKQYYTLHQSVWDDGKPRSGYFGKSRQTILYVQKVLESYEQYKSVLD